MSTNPALLNEALKKLFGAIADRSGISVVFDKHCTVPHADSSMCVTLPPPSAVDADLYWFYAMHELGHLFRELDWSYKELWHKYLSPDDEVACHVANLIVDNLNERNFYGEYDGVDGILDVGRARCMAEFMSQDLTKLKGNPVAQLLLSGIAVDLEERQDWMGAPIQGIYTDDFSDQLKYTKQIRALGYSQRVERIPWSLDPAKETYELVKDILAIIDYKVKPPPGGSSGEGEKKGTGVCKECQGTGSLPNGEPCEACEETGTCASCKGSGENPSGEPCPDCHSDSDKANAPDKSEGEVTSDRWESKQTSADGIGSGGHGKEYAGMMDEFNKNVLISNTMTRMKAPPFKMPNEYPRARRSAAGYRPWAKHKVHELESIWSQPTSYDRGLAAAIDHALEGSSVSKQISKYLKALVSESYLYGQKSGRIHQKSMYKIFGHNPSSGQQPSIYKKRNSSMVKLDSAVTLQLDCSGSMSGSKYVIGSACVVAISDTLTSLNIPHEIVGFTEHHGLTTYVFKNFHTRITREKLTAIMASRQVSMSQNADGESVLWAAERLALRPEKNKLHIVLSDGMPCGSFTGDGRAYLSHVCHMIETESPINLVGIGIATDAVKQFYKHHVVVTRPRELDTVLFGVLKNFLV